MKKILLTITIVVVSVSFTLAVYAFEGRDDKGKFRHPRTTSNAGVGKSSKLHQDQVASCEWCEIKSGVRLSSTSHNFLTQQKEAAKEDQTPKAKPKTKR